MDDVLGRLKLMGGTGLMVDYDALLSLLANLSYTIEHQCHRLGTRSSRDSLSHAGGAKNFSRSPA